MRTISRLAIFCTVAATCLTGHTADLVSGASVQIQKAADIEFSSEGMRLRLEQVADTGNVIWAIDFIDAKTMIFTERSGRLGVLQLGSGAVRYIEGAPAVFTGDSGGLFDIMVDPDFKNNRWIYLTYIKADGDISVTALARGKLKGRRLTEITDLFVANNASNDHAHWGSRVVMDGQRKLFISVGDRHVANSAQDFGSHGGKILRLNADGSVPEDNPFSTAGAAPEIWSLGHRNPQGLVIHAESGALYEQEHGPTGGDEVNLVRRGNNYGWPVITHGTNIWGGQMPEGTAKPGMEQPLRYWKPGTAPTGIAFYFGDKYPAWHADLFSATLRGPLHRLTLQQEAVVSEELLLKDWPERVRDVAQGPDGFLYLATESGRIARIVPVQ